MLGLRYISEGWETGDILGKCPRQGLLATDFLAANEGLDSDGDSTVDILSRTVLGQAHLAESFGNTHDGFQMTDLNKDRMSIPYNP
jgi:hypothetical protein